MIGAPCIVSLSDMTTYVHDIDPFAIFLDLDLGFFYLDGIRWYGLAYLAGFLAGYAFIYQMAKRGRSPLVPEDAGDLTTYCALGVLLGGRFGYVLFYQPHLLFSFKERFPWWEAIDPTGGGMASHGGMMGVMLACFLFARKRKVPFMHILDLTMLSGALAFFFGRIANFINGELYGRASDPNFAWAVKFPSEMHRWVRDATQGVGPMKEQALERLKSLGPAVESLSPITLKGGRTFEATAEAWTQWVHRLAAGGSGSVQNRFYQFIDWSIESIQNGNQKVVEALEPLLTPRYPSQLFQSAMEGLFVFVFLCLIWLKPRKPGVISCWFGISYALMRILGEQFRMPDAHLGFQALGMTRGQWLSVGLLVISVVVLFFCQRRPIERMGGIRKTS